MDQTAAPAHRAVLAAIPPARRAVLTETSDRAGLLRLAGHAGAILATGTWIGFGLPLWWALLPVQGLLLVFLFCLEHEATHRTPFRSPALSDWAGRVAGAILVLPFEWFRPFHLAHHRFTNDPERDPELAEPKPEGWKAIAWVVSGLPYWIGEVRLIAALVRGKVEGDYIPERAKPRIVREARILVGLYALAALSLIVTPLLLWVWIVPVLLGQPFLRVYLLAEHSDCPPVADMLWNTRTTYTGRLIRALAWNMPYHVEHHSWPTVPFHRLPDLHEDMRAHLKVTADGYADFARGYLDRHAGRAP